MRTVTVGMMWRFIGFRDDALLGGEGMKVSKTLDYIRIQVVSEQSIGPG